MTPVFNTRPVGDLIIELARQSGKADFGGSSATFQEYVKQSWQQIFSTLELSGDFEQWFRTALQNGGYFVDDVQLTVIKQPSFPVRFVK